MAQVHTNAVYDSSNDKRGHETGNYPTGVVTNQPTATGVQWMPKPAVIPGCPPGLEYLTQVDQLLIHQQVEMLEVLLNWEARNRYALKNSMGQQVYFASEESHVCSRIWCGNARGFAMHILDNMGQEVLRVNREFRCCAPYNCSCCICCNNCVNEVAVEAPPGQVIGYIRQICSCWTYRYQILDATRQPVLAIDAPCCMCQTICCTKDLDFVVKSIDGDVGIGNIAKQWGGCCKESFTTATNFNVSFPMDLDVKMKALMLGATFLIDFMFFEVKQDNNSG